MATRKIVPRADNEGGIGTAVKRWASGFFTSLVVGNTTFPEGGLPKFSAHKNGTNQGGVATATWTKVTFNTESWDVGSAYDAINSKWIPGIIGKAHILASIYWNNTVDLTESYIAIYKNGFIYKYFLMIMNGSSGYSIDLGRYVLIDVVTDYFEIYVHQTTGENRDINGAISPTGFVGHVLA